MSSRDDSVGPSVDDLTLDEKSQFLLAGGDPKGKATGYIPGVERVGITPLSFVDGPLGVRDGEATAFPATIGLGAAWDPDLARRVGDALAAETRAKDHHVLLAPGVNIIRVPTCGRNFEYVSEDPRLAGVIGAGYVDGLESADVAATVKHYVANNQEHARNQVSAEVDERVLREVYLPAFRETIDAGASTVMAAYNRVNGEYMTEHDRLLKDVLREEWGFEGVVVSDWWATHDTVAAALAGLDVEMPGVSPVRMFGFGNPVVRAALKLDLSGRLGIDPPLHVRLLNRLVEGDEQPDPTEFGYFGGPLREAVERGDVPVEVVDRKVQRVLDLYDRLGILADDGGAWNRGRRQVGHMDLAREAAVRGTVVLQNDGVLPLSDEDVAVIGPNADSAKVGGGGSSEVTPTESVSPVEGIRERASSVRFERGVERIPDPSMFELPSLDLRRRLRRLRADAAFTDAVTAARGADVAVVVVQDAATESEDRPSMALPGDQNRLVREVAAVAPTVVVSRSSGPVEMPWLDDVAAVVQTWYPGQADGLALADVLYGEDPGGRLPVTFGRSFEDYPVATERRYPGDDGDVHYDEGVFVGHRHFDREGVEPLFPFGHGRSYADFAFRDLRVAESVGSDRADLGCSVTVENTADRPGRTVVQAYVSAPEGPAARPPRELGGFAAVSLDPGERRRVDLSIPSWVLGRYDPGDGWTVDAGEYEVLVGRSSRDLPLSRPVTLADRRMQRV